MLPAAPTSLARLATWVFAVSGVLVITAAALHALANPAASWWLSAAAIAWFGLCYIVLRAARRTVSGRDPRYKPWLCHRCGQPLVTLRDGNCPSCGRPV